MTYIAFILDKDIFLYYNHYQSNGISSNYSNNPQEGYTNS